MSLSQELGMLRRLAFAAHATRLNQRAMFAGVAANKEKEVVNWTRKEVMKYAQSTVSAEVLCVDALKAAKLNGKSLLEMRKNQDFMNALIHNGLEPTVVHELASAVRKLLAPDPKTIFIALSGAEGQGVRFTIEDQKEMNKLRQECRTVGFIDCSSDSDGEVLVRKIEELTDGHTYRMAQGDLSRLTKLEGGFQTLQGTLKNMDEAVESDAVKALHAHLMEQHGNTDVVKLDAKKELLPKTPDGLFLILTTTQPPELWILEAKLSLTSQHAKAESDLHEYKEAAKLRFPFVGSVVTVMAGHCCDDKYKDLTAPASGFKTLRQIRQNGTEFTLSG